jgi:hypothetical protein
MRGLVSNQRALAAELARRRRATESESE